MNCVSLKYLHDECKLSVFETHVYHSANGWPMYLNALMVTRNKSMFPRYVTMRLRGLLARWHVKRGRPDQARHPGKKQLISPPQRHPNNSLPAYLPSGQLPHQQRFFTQLLTPVPLLCCHLHALRHQFVQPRRARASFPRLAHPATCKHTTALEYQSTFSRPLLAPNYSLAVHTSLVCTHKQFSQ
jgi:hypothetical protein